MRSFSQKLFRMVISISSCILISTNAYGVSIAGKNLICSADDGRTVGLLFEFQEVELIFPKMDEGTVEGWTYGWEATEDKISIGDLNRGVPSVNVQIDRYNLKFHNLLPIFPIGKVADCRLEEDSEKVYDHMFDLIKRKNQELNRKI